MSKVPLVPLPLRSFSTGHCSKPTLYKENTRIKRKKQERASEKREQRKKDTGVDEKRPVQCNVAALSDRQRKRIERGKRGGKGREFKERVVAVDSVFVSLELCYPRAPLIDRY